MVPTSFPGVHAYLRGPDDAPDRLGDIDPLPIKRDGGCMISLWRPDTDELAALNAGACVQLSIVGKVHPIVAVGVSE